MQVVAEVLDGECDPAVVRQRGGEREVGVVGAESDRFLGRHALHAAVRVPGGAGELVEGIQQVALHGERHDIVGVRGAVTVEDQPQIRILVHHGREAFQVVRGKGDTLVGRIQGHAANVQDRAAGGRTVLSFAWPYTAPSTAIWM